MNKGYIIIVEAYHRFSNKKRKYYLHWNDFGYYSFKRKEKINIEDLYLIYHKNAEGAAKSAVGQNRVMEAFKNLQERVKKKNYEVVPFLIAKRAKLSSKDIFAIEISIEEEGKGGFHENVCCCHSIF